MKVNVPSFLIGKYAVRRAERATDTTSKTTRLQTDSERPRNSQSNRSSAKSDKPAKGISGDNKDLAKLQTIVKESQEVLARVVAVFPFNLFPDIVTIDHHKLTIVYRQFFGISQTISVPIENIKNIQADCGPIFGSLTITSDHFVNNTQEVHWLWKHDATKIQRLVQGAMVANTEGIDLTKISSKELVKQLDKLGRGDTPHKKPLS